jgi:hypothetical protein
MKNIKLFLFIILFVQCRHTRNSFELKPYKVEVERVINKKNYTLIKPKIQRIDKKKSIIWYRCKNMNVKIGDTITVFLICDEKFPIK